MFLSSYFYSFPRFTKWLSYLYSSFPFSAVSPQLSRDVAEQYLAQLPLPPHPQLSALSLFSLCHTSSFGKDHCLSDWKWVNSTKRTFKNPFYRPVSDLSPFKSFLGEPRVDGARTTEIANLGALWEYAIKNHQIPPLTTLLEFLERLKLLCPLFIYIEDPSSLCSWRLYENLGGNTLMSEFLLRGLIIGWQPWVRPGLRHELATNPNRSSFSISKVFLSLSNVINDEDLHTVELQRKWKALLQLVPPHFISVECLKTQLLNQAFTSGQNTENQSNHNQNTEISLQWEDFTHQSSIFHGLEWSFDQYSLRLASCATCINAGCKPDLLQVGYGAANANDDQMLDKSTSSFCQRQVLFYAALELIARSVPTFFTPLDIVQRRYASESKTVLTDLRERCISADGSSTSLTKEEIQWLERHFSHLEPLLDHPELRFAVEVRDATEGVITGQLARYQARLPLSGALVRLHSDFFHPSRGRIDSYFLFQFHNLPSTKPPDSADPCEVEATSSTSRFSYEVQLCNVGTHSAFTSMELIHTLLGGSSSDPFLPCVVVDVVHPHGASTAASNLPCSVKEDGEGAQPMALVLGFCTGTPLSKPSHEPCCGEVLTQGPHLGAVHVFTFPISNSPTGWWRDLPQPILNLLRSLSVLKLFCSCFTKPFISTSHTYEKDESFVGSLRWPASFGSLGDLVMLTQFIGYPISGSDFSIELLRSLLIQQLGVSLHLVETDTQFSSFIFRNLTETTALAHALFLSAQRDAQSLLLFYHGFSQSDSSLSKFSTCKNSLYSSWISFVRSSPSHRVDRALTLRLYRHLHKWFSGMSPIGDGPTIHPVQSSLRSEAMECIQMPARLFSLPLCRKKELLMEITFLYGPETLPQLPPLSHPEGVPQLYSMPTKKENSPALISSETGTTQNLFTVSTAPNKEEPNNKLETKWDYMEILEGDLMRVLRKKIPHKSSIVKDVECNAEDAINSCVNDDAVHSSSSPHLQTANDNDFLSVLLTPSSQTHLHPGATFRPVQSTPCPTNTPHKTSLGTNRETFFFPDQSYPPTHPKQTNYLKGSVENNPPLSFPSPQTDSTTEVVQSFTSPSVHTKAPIGPKGRGFSSTQGLPFPRITLSEGVSPEFAPASSGLSKQTSGFRFGDYKNVPDKERDPPSRRKTGSPSFPGVAPPPATPPKISPPPQSPSRAELCTEAEDPYFIPAPKTMFMPDFTTPKPKYTPTTGADTFQSEIDDGTHEESNASHLTTADINTEKLRSLLQTEKGRLLLEELLR
ncbi:unnamed protein product [Phytomonas sp. Hart1]|nr:unnamed protein product [Phytomonas sp. Hart1]|eukprot:CCW66520.1 unnamed protein product [Phytomonas sp. isolate Hart1]